MMDGTRPQDHGALRLLLVLDDGIDAEERVVAHRWWGAIIAALRSVEIAVSVATLGPDTEWHESLRRDGCPASAFRRRSRSDVIGPARALHRSLRRHPVDAIYAQEALPAVIAGVARRLARTPAPCLYHRHHTFSSLRHELVSQLAARLANRTVVFSDAAARAACRWDGSASEDIRQVTPGVPDLRRVADREVWGARARLSLDPDAFVVVAVARLRPEKGVDVLLDALALVRRDRPVHAVVVGSGPAESALRQRAQDLRGRVHFVGHQADVALWYALSDAVAVPSRRESLGLVALEALAAGRPIAASRVGGLAETLSHDMDALLHQPGDVRGLARHLEMLVDSAALRNRLGAAGRRTFEQSYTMEEMGRSVRNLILAEAGSTPR